MSKRLTIGLFGFGVVGQGLHDIISTKDLNIEIKKIAIKNPEKERILPEHLFTTNPDDILNDPDINTVIELINDADAAYEIVTRALRSGKNVVSANKKMIAEHLDELVNLQEKYNASLLYEGAVCGSIPIIRNLEEYYDNELLHSISGIFNGSSNFILSKIANEGLEYADALKQAQELGFAEKDPILDVGGYDPKYKLVIATAHAYGVFVKPEQVLNIGIQNFSTADLHFAQEHQLKIKLVPTAKKLDEKELALYVIPKLVPKSDFLYNVENEYNAVSVKAAFADQQLFYGKGAGGHPTGSAVLSDVAALRYDYRYEYKKYHHDRKLKLQNDHIIPVYIRYNNESLINNIHFEFIAEQHKSIELSYVLGGVKISELIAKKNDILNDGAFLAQAGALTEKFEELKRLKLEKA
ncbi:MAG: homoserine dehydrogenase [Sphingobacteriales bacterium 17-39-43]|uniref:homoserine dehydrogenase n=1 Tax=Daejeonella sp. TaxID=2805397 RepID=UPI000BCD67C9|nr:homoserine dehydrogenase [Daejeonella sp.]OYZ32919.1 MAG: homoserine dehydrogenase [Sphingobacteriales bacterium 16-39-50]OZA26329.1 MAG: homoserine dehydrogenase [Sphingobacteriales bacterium 17-39-43]HQT23500.1 homoserine dehydrogenase [Daejeonella sp.]HQT56185.1 homoserine dehydrogenase [Daejeonella sp.]